MVTIPTRSEYDYTEEVSLDDVSYQLRFRWNHRGQFGTMDVLTREGVVLVAGLKIALNAPLMRAHPGLGLPEGETLVVDPSASTAAIAFADLGARIALVHASEAEYDAL